MRDTARRDVIGEIRVGALSLALLAGLSCAATVIIIAGGNGRSAAQLAALAALRERPVVIAAHGSAAGSASRRGSRQATAPAAESSSAPPATGQSPPSKAPNAATTAQNTPASPPPTATTTTALPKVGHVFEIALSTDSYKDAFGKHSAAPYLRSLEHKGVLLSGFQSLGSSELADYLAMVSGQAPNADTSGGCSTYAEFPQGTAAQPDGVVRGDGCVYPETALTIGDQVTASGHVWKAYIADMGAQTCAHPNSNAVVDSALPGTQPGYDTAHNPFIYFHSLVDLGDCANDDQNLSRLGPALAKRSRTPTFSFIAPGACDDPASDAASSPAAGSTPTSTTSTPTSTTSTTTTSSTATSPTTTAPTTTSPTTTAPTATSPTTTAPTTSTSSTAPAACPAGQTAGIAAENAFLRSWVPQILASKAYRHNGVLIIAFAANGHRDSAHAVRTGALVLSRYARPGKKLRRAFGPYSLLRSIEVMLGYKPLAHASTAPSFAAAGLTQTK